METHYRHINNQWGLVLSKGTNILYVFTFQIQRNCIQAIDVIANPAKLTYIKRQRDTWRVTPQDGEAPTSNHPGRMISS